MAAEGGLRGKGAAWRADCPHCGRSTAVTWDKRTGDGYFRSHNVAVGERCPMSRRCATTGKHRKVYPGDHRE